MEEVNLWERIKAITDPRNFPNLSALGITEDDQPDRVVLRKVRCDEYVDDWDDFDYLNHCDWSGMWEVSFWDDTQEAGWTCPNGHENYIRWTASK